LPAIAANIRRSSGIAIAAMTSTPMRPVRLSNPPPSAGMRQELASRPASVAFRLVPISVENDISTSVAPEMMNQVETSWLLATSPRLSASSSRFWVGSSDFSVSSVSSAIAPRHE
jgi:hypothetical protein